MQLRHQMMECRLEKDSVFMFLLQKIGVLYFRQYDYAAAIGFTRESILIARQLPATDSSKALALASDYYNLYYFYSQTKQLQKKYEAIDSCITYALQGEKGLQMVLAPLEEKTDYLFNKGQYSLCTSDARLGEEIIRAEHGNKDSIEYVVFFVNEQANALYFSKNMPAARQLLENKISQFEKAGYSNQLGPFYSLLGEINNDEKNYVKALADFQMAFNKDSALKFRQGCAQNLTRIGMLYGKNPAATGRAIAYSFAALAYAGADDSLVILKQIANIHAFNKKYDSARYYFQCAYNIVQHGMNETTTLKTSFKFPSFNLLQSLSDLAKDEGDAYLHQYYDSKNDSFLKRALSIYKTDDLFLAKVRTDQQLDLSSNLVWRTTARNLYEHALEACYADNDIPGAFYFFEKSRAVLLNDQINEQRWTADSDIAHEARLQKAVADLEEKLAVNSPSSGGYLATQKELYNYNEQQMVLADRIKSKNPLFYKTYLDTTFITVDELSRDVLGNSQLFMEIFYGNSSVFELAITSRNKYFFKIDKALYDSLTGRYISFISNRYELNSRFRDFTTTANRLYNLLFSKIKPRGGSLIISPDGISFPFEALVMNNDVQNPDYLLNHYAVSYTYSANYLTDQFAESSNASNNVLGIAPVQYNNDHLATLSGSDLSLQNIHTYFGNASNYTFSKATKNNFLKNFPSYNIIQLYTHASGTSVDNDPVIYFSDSALYLSALIPDRKPVTQLVVLSACETGNGKFYEGEGIFSFNRGFAALGIPAAVSNLWSVDNESTYSITELFYKYLSKGLPTDVALQKAKLEFINNNSSSEKKLPYFWAATILTGKVNTITKPGSFSWSLWLGIALALSSIVLLAIRFSRSKYKNEK